MSVTVGSDACVPVKGATTITGAGADAAAQRADKRNKQATFKSCAPFCNCISQANNTQADNVEYPDNDAHDNPDNLIECSDSYVKTSGSLLQYHKDIPNDNIAILSHSNSKQEKQEEPLMMVTQRTLK